MKSIYKYRLPVADASVVYLPKDAKFLHAGLQEGYLYLWAMINPDEVDVEKRHLRCYGTGHNILNPDSLEFISTIVDDKAGFVWHIFEQK